MCKVDKWQPGQFFTRFAFNETDAAGACDFLAGAFFALKKYIKVGSELQGSQLPKKHFHFGRRFTWIFLELFLVAAQLGWQTR